MEVKEVRALISSVVAVAGSNERIARTLFQSLSSAMESRGQTGAYKASGNVVLGVAFADSGISISFDGHLFGQYSNAKAVLDGYRKEGTSFFSKLDGFFAFCLWDEENDILVAARDPFGVRPLYYMCLGRTIILVSQISAFFALNKTLKPNENLICEYLLTGNHPRNGQTFYEEIKEVLPGQYLTISDNNITAQKSYGASNKQIAANKGNQNSVEEFSALFTKTVQRMIPREGYATSLSGGLDSTLLASTIQKFESDNNHKLYSVVCKRASYKDWELPYIEDFKRHIDKDVNYLEVPFPPSWRDLEDYVNQISEPASLLIYYISYVIAKNLANDKINVVFTGTGGDDFMLGLEWQHTDYLRELWRRKDFYRFIREGFGYLLSQAYLLSAHDVKSIGTFAKIRFRGPEKNLDFLNSEFVRRNYRKPSRSDCDSISDIIEYAEYLDRIYASKGIEPLHPFLDKELANYMRNLPSDAKIRWGTRKYLLRQIAKGLVPESIRKCKRKFASSLPLSGWLIAWKDYIEEILDSAEFSQRGYYNVENIRHAYKKMLDRQLDPIQEFRIAAQLWRVINLELWLRKSPAIRSFHG